MRTRRGYSSIGFDLQPTAAKAVQLKHSSTGTSLAGAASFSFDESFLSVAEDSANADAARSRLAQELKASLKEAGFAGESAVISLPPTKVDVRTLMLSSADVDLEKMLQWEAESYLHYNVAEAILDYAKLGEVNVGNEKRAEVLVAAAQRSYIVGLLEVFSKAGLEVSAADIIPMALWRLGKHFAGDFDAPVAIIDIGRTTSIAVIVHCGELRLTRKIPRGGDEITQRIIQSLEVSEEEAVFLKTEHGVGAPNHFSFGSGEELKTATEVAGTIHEILRDDLDDLADELVKLFRYFSTQSKGLPVSRGYLCGGGGKLKGLAEFLTQTTGTPIEMLPALNEAFHSETIAGPEYAAAVGMALRDA